MFTVAHIAIALDIGNSGYVRTHRLGGSVYQSLKVPIHGVSYMEWPLSSTVKNLAVDGLIIIALAPNIDLKML